MMGILVGAVLVLAGLFQAGDGFSILRKADTIMQQQFAATTLVGAAILVVGGLLMMVLGYGNIVAAGLRKEMVGFRKDLAKMWEFDQAKGASGDRPRDINVRPGNVGPANSSRYVACQVCGADVPSGAVVCACGNILSKSGHETLHPS